MSLRKISKLYETETHIVVEKMTAVDDVETLIEEKYPKTEDGFVQAWVVGMGLPKEYIVSDEDLIR